MKLEKWQIIAMVFFSVILCFMTASMVFLYGSYERAAVTVPSDPHFQAGPSPTLDPLRPYSVLLMGYGGGGHEGGKLTDTMIVARVDPRAKQLHLISIPRDLWVSFPSSADGETYWKVNAAYAIGSDQRGYASRPDVFKGEGGGGALARYAVAKIVGFPIDYFVTLNFNGFERSVDVLNGIDVRVERMFDDYLYPIEGMEEDTCGKSPEEMEASATFSAELAEKEFPCRYEHLHFDAGIQRLDGETALKYVRSRHGSQDGSDFGRAARQRNTISAVKNRIFEINFLPKAIPFIATLAGNIETDIGLGKMQEWLSQASEFEDYTIYSIALTDKNVLAQGRSNNGQYIMMPKDGIDQWAIIHTFIQDEIQKTASQSGSLKP